MNALRLLRRTRVALAAAGLAVAVAVAATSAPAAVPQTIAFQGYLTDDNGQPRNGTVNLDVAVYAAAAGGTALWSESQAAVPVNSGVFAIALGSVTPLAAGVARTSPRYLGIRVDGGPELPRTELRATPFALRAQAADTTTGALDIHVASGVNLTAKGRQDGYPLDLEWGAMDNSRVSVQLGGSTVGDGRLMLCSQGNSTFFAMGDNWRDGSPALYMYGANRNIILDTHFDGDMSVRLPANAIGSSEINAEPGLASANNTNAIALTATAAPVISRTITAPANGFVLALGQSVARITHTSGTPTTGAVGLSDDGVSFGTAQDVNLQIATNAASGAYALPAHLNGVFNATAGTPLTIYMLAMASSGSINLEDLSLTLLFVPTGYGTVTQTLATPPDGAAAPPRGPLTTAEIAQEQAESARANAERLERELAAMRASYDQRLAGIEAHLRQDGQ